LNKIFLSLMLLVSGASLFAQYPDVSIYEIQTVPPGGDESPLLDDTVHVCGIVTVGTDIFYAGSGVSFFMQDSEGGPFSGIMVYCAFSDSIPSLVRGDSICFLGVVSEYSWPYDPPYNSNTTEIIILPGSFELISHGHPLPPPMIITAEMIDSTNGADSLAEQYEACPVRVCYATVDSVVVYTTTSIWVCHDTTSHQFIVREASDSIDYLPPPVTNFRFVQGIIYQRFGAYNVQSVYMDNLGFFGYHEGFWHWPEYPSEDDTIFFYLVTPGESDIVSATLYLRFNLGSWMGNQMIPITDTLFNLIIPPMSAGTRFDYYLEMEDSSGNIRTDPLEAPWNFYTLWVESPEGIADEELSLPNNIMLYQNYPNPFNASTTITFTLPKASFVTLKVFDLLGREVAILTESQLVKGAHSVNFKDMNLAGGIYFYQLRTDEFTQTKRMILIK